MARKLLRATLCSAGALPAFMPHSGTELQGSVRVRGRRGWPLASGERYISSMTLLKSFLVAALLWVVPVSAVLAEDNCISDWSEAAPLVRQHGLMPVEKLTPLARQKLKGDIVKVTLCKENGAYVYRLVVREPSGPMRTITVDAKTPF